MERVIQYIYIILISLAIAACGGGGGGGGDSTNGDITGEDDSSTGGDTAVFKTENEEDLSKAAASGAMQAIAADGASGNLGFTGTSPKSIKSKTESVLTDTAERLAYAPTEVEGICDPGGTVTMDSDPSGNATIVYNNCTISFGTDSITFDGSISIVQNTSTNTSTITFNSLSIDATADGQTQSTTTSGQCTINGTTFEVSCTYDEFTSSGTGIDGRTYTVSDVSVSGDDFSGYSVSATVTDPDWGSIDITTTSPLLFNCAGNQPSSGEIQVTDGEGTVVTITFNDCSSFTVAYSGIPTVYNW